MRPDEQASKSIIAKNQKLNEKQKRFLRNAGKTALGATGTAALGLASARILPLLNDLIPVDLAVKGISKINPKIGGVLEKGIRDGLDPKEGLKFLRGQLLSEETEDEEQNKINAAMKQAEQMQEQLKQFSASPPSGIKQNYQTPQKQPSLMEQIRAANTPEAQEQMLPPSQQMGQGQQALMAIMQKINQKLGG